MKKFIVACLLTVGVCASAQAIPTPESVEALIVSGKTAEAKVALQEVLAENPDSIKANYYMAQIVKDEGGDTLSYDIKYKAFLERMAAEEVKIKAEQEEKLNAFVLYSCKVIIAVIISALLMIGIVFWFIKHNQAKELKKKIEQEEAQLEMSRVNLLKHAMIANEKLLANKFKDEDVASLHRQYAIDAIEDLTKNQKTFNKTLIEQWIMDANEFFIGELT